TRLPDLRCAGVGLHRDAVRRALAHGARLGAQRGRWTGRGRRTARAVSRAAAAHHGVGATGGVVAARTARYVARLVATGDARRGRGGGCRPDDAVDAHERGTVL